MAWIGKAGLCFVPDTDTKRVDEYLLALRGRPSLTLSKIQPHCGYCHVMMLTRLAACTAGSNLKRKVNPGTGNVTRFEVRVRRCQFLVQRPSFDRIPSTNIPTDSCSSVPSSIYRVDLSGQSLAVWTRSTLWEGLVRPNRRGDSQHRGTSS